MAGIEVSVTIIVGMALAAASIIWLWHATARPGLINLQEDTLTKMHERQNVMQREIDELRRTIADNHELYEEELGELRAVLDEWWQGMKLVFEQMAGAQLVPVWQPKPIPPKRRLRTGHQELIRFIAPRFSVEEIDGLAFELGLAKDELSGDTRETRARALVQWAADHDRLSDLRRRVEDARPAHY